MPKLLLIRHGRTNLQKEDRFWGNTDIPLNEAGITQAKMLRERLTAENITHIYSSTLSRARDTAKIIAAPHRRDVTACEELCECNFGYAEGLTYEEIKRLHPEVAEQLGKMEWVDFPGGENLEKFHKRVSAFLKRLEKLKAQDTAAVVAHGGSLRMLICHLLGLDARQWHQIRIDQASLSIVDMYPQVCILGLLNDTSHLKQS